MFIKNMNTDGFINLNYAYEYALYECENEQRNFDIAEKQREYLKLFIHRAACLNIQKFFSDLAQYFKTDGIEVNNIQEIAQDSKGCLYINFDVNIPKDDFYTLLGEIKSDEELWAAFDYTCEKYKNREGVVYFGLPTIENSEGGFERTDAIYNSLLSLGELTQEEFESELDSNISGVYTMLCILLQTYAAKFSSDKYSPTRKTSHIYDFVNAVGIAAPSVPYKYSIGVDKISNIFLEYLGG